MKKVMAVALLTMLSNWAAAAEAPLTAVTNVGGSVAASQAPAASTALATIAVLAPGACEAATLPPAFVTAVRGASAAAAPSLNIPHKATAITFFILSPF